MVQFENSPVRASSSGMAFAKAQTCLTLQLPVVHSLAVLPANYSFTVADVGTHTFSAALKTVGTHSITVHD
jgi:hypothetical protein